MVTLSRGAFLKLAAATAATGILAACSTGTKQDAATTASASTEAYTIKHAYGETTFKSIPTKIAVVQNWINPDVLLALGVAPVGTPLVTWGQNDNNSTPWFDAKLKEIGGAEPTRYDETDGPNYEELAKLAPDAIFTVYGDMNQEIYDKLSEIAPVVTAPEGVGPWAASWQQVVEQAGLMLKKEKEAAALIEETEKKITEAAKKHPDIAGASFIAGAFDAEQNTFGAYTSTDTRPRFFTLMGMELANYIKENQTADSFYMNISAEVMDSLEADVVWAWVNDAADVEKIKSNELFSKMPAMQKDAVIFESNKTVGLAASAASPLSLTWLVQETELLNNFTAAVKKSKA